MKMRDYIYIADLSNRGDFDDYYNISMRQHFKGKDFDNLDDEQQLWVCYMFDKDCLQRD